MAARRRQNRRSPDANRPDARGRLTPRRQSAYLTAIVLLGVVVFWNSLHGPFLFDDVASIPDNPTIRSLWPLSGPLSPPTRSETVAGRPFVNLSLAVNYAAGGLDVRGYHAVNIAIHITCGLLFFALVRRTLASPVLPDDVREHADGAALASALIWLVHPLASEPVDYTVARTESLMAMFLLLTLYCSLRTFGSYGSKGSHGSKGSKGSTRWRVFAVLSCAAGMACKETMAAAPIVVLLYDRVFWPEAMARRWSFYASLAATWIVLALLIWSGPRAHSVGSSAADVYGITTWTYLLNQAVMVVRYLRLLVWPRGLVLDYGFPRPLTLTDVAAPAGLVLVLLAATIVALRRWPPLGFAGAWFFLILAPSSSVVPVVTEVGAERRAYLPSAALVVLLVTLAGMGIRWASNVRLKPDATARIRLKPDTTAVAVAVIALVALTMVRNREYRSPLTMWQTNVERWPNGRAYSNLATELQAAGRSSEVIPALREAVRDFPDAEYDLGAQLIAAGQFPDAAAHLEAFLRERPDHPKAAGARTLLIRAWTDAGVASAKRGETDNAVDAFRRALAADPENADLHRNLANALLERQDFAGAAREARAALQARPGDPVAEEILAIATADAGRRSP